MEYVKKIVAFRITRFVVVGLGNTTFNFAVLNFVFYGLHQTKLVSSFIATACAVMLSFALNRSFVFVDKERPAKKLALFILVTAGGVLLIQNSVYALMLALLQHHGVNNDFLVINLGNLVASLMVMIWNYNGYRIFVFRGERHKNVVIETD